ncbi:hypothetical protein N7463_003682 [Penicillium fimorum]|uniref:O-methyltransferase C-terminal domain-containing protein n=1 Tax=Penicillium fimorum TaxID=1882269 RepID=A0A9X0CA60_9EURO|nr:hypothetical protein N7463_003682 [Penicillium fimorum]
MMKGYFLTIRLTALSSKSIDLLNAIEKLLEPGQLILADHFLDKPTCAFVSRRLAEASGAWGDRLAKVMKVLQNNGIFTFHPSQATCTNNYTFTLLLCDHWTQWHNWVDLYSTRFYDMSRGIPASIQKEASRTPAQIHYDTAQDMFTYFREQGWVGQLHRTLGGGATAQAPGIVTDYPWDELSGEVVMDTIDGGGALIALLMRAHLTMNGGIYDLAHVIEHTVPFFHSRDGQFADLKDRVPRENLIGDPQALEILRNIRQAILPGAGRRLIILESVRLSRYADLNMMVTANGLERTEHSWRRLAEQSGLEIVAIHSMRNAWPCAIDLWPVGL